MELEYFDQIIFDYFDRNIFDKEWTKSGKQFKHVLISLLCFALPVCILPSLDVIRVDSSFFHILFRSLTRLVHGTRRNSIFRGFFWGFKWKQLPRALFFLFFDFLLWVR